jgi:hypothetical protein
MAIEHLPTVWILGAGFSKSLGGPLLVDLFRQEYLQDLAQVLRNDLANDLTWVQALYNYGRHEEHVWENAEDFLAYVDAAHCGDDKGLTKRQRKTLQGIYARAMCPQGPSAPGPHHLASDVFQQQREDPIRTVRRALAAESSAFLDADNRGEAWASYREWARTLDPERDSIITFNYDTVVDTLDPDRFEILLPHSPEPSRTKVPVMKLHGSWNWHFDQRTKSISVNNMTIEANLPIAIAAPGRSKASSVAERFAPLWKTAREKLKHAYSVVILGYGFPKTDAQARMELLSGIEEAVGTPVKRIELVLGPDINRPEAQRVLELVRQRTGRSRTFIDSEPEHLVTSGEQVAVIRQHRLWAEDFIGDYWKRTALKTPYPVKGVVNYA